MERLAQQHDPHDLYGRIPTELRQRQRWLVWRRELRANTQGQTLYAKEPYNARTSIKSSATDPATWANFEQAQEAMASGRFDGLGFAFSADDGLVFIDLDGCITASGALSPFAAWVVSQVPGYVEVSQSGRGLHIITKGVKPGPACRSDEHHLEMYSDNRFCALTGDVFQRRDSLADGASGVRAVYSTIWPKRMRQSEQSAQDALLDEPDELVLQRVGQEDRFDALWAGQWEGEFPSQSEADATLCLLLLRACGGDPQRADELFRKSGLMREKWDEQRGAQTYGETTLDFALRGYQQPRESRKREFRRIRFAYDWQRRTETLEERQEVLRQAMERVKERVRRHVMEHAQHPLGVTTPPGSGKSHAVAELGKEFDLAWVAERHAMVESVPALQDFIHIQPANATTCPRYYPLHDALAKAGRNTWPVHKEHKCQYGEQHRAEGSAVYQLEHVRTSYVLKHDGIIVDEMNLASWLRERAISSDAITRVLAAPGWLTETVALHYEAARLLKGVLAALDLAKRESRVLYGKELFDLLNDACQGRLAEMVNTLKLDSKATQSRPPLVLDPDDPDALREALELVPVVLPFLLSALADELSAWQRGGAWNSRIRIACHLDKREDWALRILEPLRFPENSGEPLPPRVLLDATANPDLLRRIGWENAEIVHEEIIPPPNMRHIAVRTGKRYSKGSMVSARPSAHYADTTARYRNRVIREARYLLSQLDPDGAYRQTGQVGLITFADCEDEMRAALGIVDGKSGHFWAQRGSNALEGCTILLVIGTPLPNLDGVLCWARMLWSDDPDPIEDLDDPRVQQLADYLSQAELTQCAHRNRPLRHDGRIVVTMCAGDIADLPVTELVTQLPQLRESGARHDEAKQREVEEQLERAAASFVAQGVEPSVRKLQALVHVRASVISGWLASWRARRAAA